MPPPLPMPPEGTLVSVPEPAMPPPGTSVAGPPMPPEGTLVSDPEESLPELSPFGIRLERGASAGGWTAEVVSAVCVDATGAPVVGVAGGVFCPCKGDTSSQGVGDWAARDATSESRVSVVVSVNSELISPLSKTSWRDASTSLPL